MSPSPGMARPVAAESTEAIREIAVRARNLFLARAAIIFELKISS